MYVGTLHLLSHSANVDGNIGVHTLSQKAMYLGLLANLKG